MSGAITLKFWGVRGSHPVPGGKTLRYGGNTACIEVHMGEQRLILDAGTGIIALGSELSARSKQWGTPLNLTLLLSHLHHDHIQGLPFFSPAYAPSTLLHILGPSLQEGELEGALRRSMEPPAFPVSLDELACTKTITGLHGGEAFLLTAQGLVPQTENEPPEGSGVLVRVMRSYGHPGGVLIYRLDWHDRSVVYATDTEGYVGTDKRLADFARGADLLIHDAQYSDEHYRCLLPGLPAVQGFGHSTVEMACDLAKAAGVHQLVLFHHDPNYDDETIAAMESRARFPRTISAFEGLEISLETHQAVAVAAKRLHGSKIPASAPAQAVTGRRLPAHKGTGSAPALEAGSAAPRETGPSTTNVSPQAQAGIACHDRSSNGSLGRRIQFLRSRTAIFGHDRPTRRPT